MTIALPLLLLIIGIISFWLLVQSRISWKLKIPTIGMYCIFVVFFFQSITSFLGWGATDMPERVSIHGVVVKEPNPFQKSRGSIFLTVESYHNIYENRLLHMFGYNSEKQEPRMYRLPYSRNLHEQLEHEVIPKLREGQVVDGAFKKGKAKGKDAAKGKKGDGKQDGKGDGSESQEQEYQFYNLNPSEIQPK